MTESRFLRPLFAMIALLGAFLLPAVLPGFAQSPAATAEAIGQANLRATTDVEADLVGQITAGTRYPVIGRSEFFPWLLLGDPATQQPLGWVFAELVNVQGSVNSVPFSTLIVDGSTPAAAPTQAVPSAAAPVDSAAPTASAPTPSPTPQLQAAVVGTVNGEINIRYGPGVDYPRIGVARAGERYEISAWHTQLPWVQIRYPDAPNGFGWVALELLDVQGSLFDLPAISQTSFRLPTLTPTPPVVQPSESFSREPVPVSPEFTALGESLWGMVLDAGFDPQTSRLGALFLMDLRTGEAVTFGDDIAFSGMSLSKIAILTTLYSSMDQLPDDAQINTIADAMICSENISSNRMLSMISGGNPYEGANRVSEFLQQLGLQRTFLYTPYANDPFITPQAPQTRTTDADQTSAQPDPFNQMTVSELGGLLDSLYQCGVNESGPLLENFPEQFTAAECRQMITVMSGNRIGSLIESGVPVDIRVAHKHGWIDDTHGDAAIVFTPGGDYALVVALHNPVWLNFDESAPLIAEISRAVYNHYNPDAPLEAVREEIVPECNLLGNPIVDQLLTEAP